MSPGLFLLTSLCIYISLCITHKAKSVSYHRLFNLKFKGFSLLHPSLCQSCTSFHLFLFASNWYPIMHLKTKVFIILFYLYLPQSLRPWLTYLHWEWLHIIHFEINSSFCYMFSIYHPSLSLRSVLTFPFPLSGMELYYAFEFQLLILLFSLSILPSLSLFLISPFLSLYHSDIVSLLVLRTKTVKSFMFFISRFFSPSIGHFLPSLFLSL